MCCHPTAVAIIFKVQVKLIPILKRIRVNCTAFLGLADERFIAGVFELPFRLVAYCHTYALLAGGLVAAVGSAIVCGISTDLA